MSALKKFKLKKDIAKQIAKEDSGNKTDDRFVPYYSMKDGEKMKVLIVPDSNGDLFKKYSTHGPNLKVRGVGAVGCLYKNHGRDCPACQKGFGLLDLAKETGDQSYKDEAKRWFAKDTTVMSVIVLESPVEIPVSSDGNEVKLMYVPFAVEQMIRNALIEGQIDEDELTSTPLWIKRTTNKGGQAAYDTSFFDRKPVSDEELSLFDEDGIVVEPYDYDNLDIVPDEPTEDEVLEWLAKAEEAVEKSKNAGSSKKSEQKTTKGLADRLKERQAAKQEEEPEQEEEEAEEEEEKVETKPAPTSSSKTQSLRERLAAAKNR